MGSAGAASRWLAIVIAGILIALVVDRLVRDFDARQDSAEARANLRVEIGTSTTPFDEAIRRLGPGRVVEPR